MQYTQVNNTWDLRGIYPRYYGECVFYETNFKPVYFDVIEIILHSKN